jgi:micrococcal nuclease
MHLIPAASLCVLTLVIQSPRWDQHHAVRYAVDGDTLEVAGVGRVRLLGIDAPELGRGFDTAAPLAREARERLATLVARRFVRLELDGERRDGRGRVLAYVIRDDGLFVNAELLRAGFARISARRQLRRLDELRRAEEEARSEHRGMWRD